MLCLGFATLLLVIATMHLVFQANLSGSNNIGPLIWVFMLCYLTFTAFWTVSIYKRFTNRRNALKVTATFNLVFFLTS